MQLQTLFRETAPVDAGRAVPLPRLSRKLIAGAPADTPKPQLGVPMPTGDAAADAAAATAAASRAAGVDAALVEPLRESDHADVEELDAAAEAVLDVRLSAGSGGGEVIATLAATRAAERVQRRRDGTGPGRESAGDTAPVHAAAVDPLAPQWQFDLDDRPRRGSGELREQQPGHVQRAVQLPRRNRLFAPLADGRGGGRRLAAAGDAPSTERAAMDAAAGEQVARSGYVVPRAPQ